MRNKIIWSITHLQDIQVIQIAQKRTVQCPGGKKNANNSFVLILVQPILSICPFYLVQIKYKQITKSPYLRVLHSYITPDFLFNQHNLRYNLLEACEILFCLTDCHEFEGEEVLLTVHQLTNTLLHFSVNIFFSSTLNDHYCTVQDQQCDNRAGIMMRQVIN